MDNTVGYTAGDTIGNTAGRRRLDLKAAALELGVTSEAIRRRAKRGTLPSEKGEDGLLYVWVPAVYDRVHDASDGRVHDVSDGGLHAGEVDGPTASHLPEVLLERFEDENGFLRQELERKDAILLTMAKRIPELEASSEPPGAPQTVLEQQSSWWRRWFGFP